MNTALLVNGRVIRAEEYRPEVHGHRIFCIDSGCKAPLIHVTKSENKAAHFKSTGKSDSKHVSSCGFYEPLTLQKAIQKVTEYQADLLTKGIRENVIRLNLNRIDPDYEPRQVERKSEKDKENEEEIKTKNDNQQPAVISSVKSVAKLLTDFEPDLLASILINVGGGRKVPLSDIVIGQERAHEKLWSDQALKTGYFVYGAVAKVTKLDKVIYIDFEKINDVSFTLVVFEKYFSTFTYTEEDLNGFDVLVYGMLKKNEHKGKNRTEMIIKTDKYIEKIKKNR